MLSSDLLKHQPNYYSADSDFNDVQIKDRTSIPWPPLEITEISWFATDDSSMLLHGRHALFQEYAQHFVNKLMICSLYKPEQNAFMSL